MNRRYIAAIAAVAIVTLAAGLFVKQRLRREVPAAAAVAPPTETAALQELSQEGQVRRLSAFLNERATDVASLVEYVPENQASGLRWRGGDTLITTHPDRPIVTLSVARSDTTRTPLIAPSDSARGDWALVVARRRDGGFVSAAGIVGGQMPVRCHDRDVTEYVLGVVIPEGFAGAGVFDLTGRVIGMVARCGDRLAVLPAAEITRLMSNPDSSGRVLRSRFGFVARPLDRAARAYFGADSGLLVTDVDLDRPADAAGWLPGDIITRIDGVAIDSVIPVPIVDALAVADSHVVLVRRGDTSRLTRLTLARRPLAQSRERTDLGLTIGRSSTGSGALIEDVRAGSRADSAGLRPGDWLVRVGSVAVTTGGAGRRLLDPLRLTDSVTFVVVRRDSVARGIWLRR